MSSPSKSQVLGAQVRFILSWLLVAILVGATVVVSQEHSVGSAPPPPISDKNGDNNVDPKDLLLLLQEWRDRQTVLEDVLSLGEEWYMHGMGDASTPTHTPNETDFRTPTYTPSETELSTPTPTPVDPELFYYYYAERIYFTPSEDVIWVAFQEGLDEGQRLAFLADYQQLAGFSNDEPLPNSGPYQIVLTGPTPWLDLKELLGTLSADTQARYISPLLHTNTGALLVLTNEFLVRFNADVTPEQIESLNETHGVSVVDTRHGNYTLTREGERNTLRILQLANRYFETGLVEWAEPNAYSMRLLHSD